MNWGAWRRTASMAVVLGALSGASAQAFEVDVVSSHPDLVTAGDALIRVSDPAAIPTVRLNERDISVSWKFSEDDRSTWYGMVYGLLEGRNQLNVSDGIDEYAVTLTNHQVQDTLFAGPQDTPFLCELETFGLNPTVVSKLNPWKADCAAPSRTVYLYRNTANEWLPFNAHGPRPTDIGTGVDADGQPFPLIVRQEIGVINRSAYVINIPHDPGAGPAPNVASHGGSAWNGKLIYSFGAGARGDGHHQGRGLANLAADRAFMEEGTTGTGDYYITHGYAIAAGSLNAFGTTTDDVVSAETAAKVKEHFIELFGPPKFTIGHGVSGGSMQQFLVANAYPGILDGIIPHRQYADAITFSQPLYDCELLSKVFEGTDLTREQMEAVSGKYWGFCVSNAARYPTRRASNCDTAVVAMIDADATIAPEDVRCTFNDDLQQVFGIDPGTGTTRSIWDNVGVQYGLGALNDGAITFEQFIDINRRIGGHDNDGAIVPGQRMAGDPVALKAAYETGRLNLMTGGNSAIPIVMTRFYNDGDALMRGDANVDVHDAYHSYVVMARAEKYLGNRDNIVNYFAAQGGEGGAAEGTPYRLMAIEAVEVLDQWLTNIGDDDSGLSAAEKVAADRPDQAGDACWTANGGSFYATLDSMGAVEKVTDWDRCAEIFPTTTEPRMVAGGPLTADILKCQLKSVDAADYTIAPSAEQLTALDEVFSEGVCDWTKPGVGQADVMTWVSFQGDGVYHPLD